MLTHNLYPVTYVKGENLRINLYLTSSNLIRKMKSLNHLSFNTQESDVKKAKDVATLYYRKLSMDDGQLYSTKNRQILIERILETRKKAARLIQKFFLKFYEKKKKLKEEFIKHILASRHRMAIIIQKTVRMFLVRQDVNKVLNPPKHICIYRMEKKCEKVKLQIKLLDKNKTINFNYSRPLDLYYAYISKPKLLPRKMRIHFLINNKIVIDSRYPVDSMHGEFYNIVETGNIFKKPKGEYEKIFEIFSEKSVSSQASDTIDKLFRHSLQPRRVQHKEPKSILRKSKFKTNKSVSFAATNQYYS